jgi:hypothetical protein
MIISCGGKGGRCVGMTTLPPSPACFLEIWEPQLPGALRACPEFIATAVPLILLALPISNSEKEPAGLRSLLFCLFLLRVSGFLMVKDHADYCGLVRGLHLAK